jgi:cytochrome o ubiquinol oxidase operon protein cyoD
MTQGFDTDDRTQQIRNERKEFQSYVWGIGLAFLMTVIPFTMARWTLAPRFTLLILIGAFALAQIIIHFRFFLHISFNHRREDLGLILFSTLLLIIMVGGTIWIMASLALRMAMPAMP